MASVTTDDSGAAVLPMLPDGPLVVEALVLEPGRSGIALRELAPIDRPSVVRFDLQRDFLFGPVIEAFTRSGEEDASTATARLAYGLPAEEHARQVSAVLEIDRVAGVELPQLVATTRDGRLDLEQVMAEVGIELRVLVSDLIPAGELAGPAWPPAAHRLQSVMQRYRNAAVPPEHWSFYLLLAPLPEPGIELSYLIDPDRRRGAVIYLNREQREEAALHAVVHELGHLLNLPHPWEVSGNTRSAMSYPWRWQEWDWGDPRVYRLDAAGRFHIQHGPERFVRPGAGPFLDYGDGTATGPLLLTPGDPW